MSRPSPQSHPRLWYGPDPRPGGDPGASSHPRAGIPGTDPDAHAGGSPNAGPDPHAGGSPNADPDVEVRVSPRRRKTATAYWQDGRVVVVLPAHVRGAARTELVAKLVARVVARRPGIHPSDEALFLRAARLADRYVDGVRPTSVRWVTNQRKRWGSCSIDTGEIRLSHRLRAVPEWVLDTVLVHELAHLVEPSHSARFREIAGRHPRQRDAAIFLEGLSLGLDRPE